VKRGTSSKSQSNAGKKGLKGVSTGAKGKRREIPVKHYPNNNATGIQSAHPPQMPYPLYHSMQRLPLPSLQQNQGDSTSLASLTVRFVQLLNRVSPPYGNGELDLNVAMENLSVQKRRLYDVTNVLEGIGLIKKENKNNVSWAQRSSEKPSKESQMAEKGLQKEIESHKQHAKQLDDYIELLSKRVRDYTTPQSQSQPLQSMGNAMGNEKGMGKDCASTSASSLYVTKKEISSLRNYANDTVIAIRAPSGTSLEVPNPDDGMRPGMRRFQIYLTSPQGEDSGQVNIFLVQHGDNRSSTSSNTHGAIGAGVDDVAQRQLGNGNRKNDVPSSNWNSQPQHQRQHSHSGNSSNTYPVQSERPKQRSMTTEAKSRYPPTRPYRHEHLRPPHLPGPESLPKFTVSPIEAKKLSHRPKLADDKPDYCSSRRSSSQSTSSSSTGSRRPSLKRRPSTDMPPCIRGPLMSPPDSRPVVKTEPSISDNRNLLKKRKCNERVTSPIPSTSMTLEKIQSSPTSERFASIINEPSTPCNILSGTKLMNQSSFDLYNAPLNSPSAFLSSPMGYLASPAATRSNNMHGLGTSALTSSPFRFSPNFQAGELSPFFNTPTAFRMDSRFGSTMEKSENDNELSNALF
jgi:hypothetical protein